MNSLGFSSSASEFEVEDGASLKGGVDINMACNLCSNQVFFSRAS
jgi:hypothetical protein